MSTRPPPYLVPALAAMQRGDLAGAQDAAEQALAQVGEQPALRHLLGVLCCRQGDLATGIEHLEAALALQPDNAEVRTVLARALVDDGRSARAHALAGGSNQPQLIEVEAEAARAIGDHAASVAALFRLIALRPRDAALRRAYGHALLQAGDALRASEALDIAVQLDPGDVATRAELATLLSDLGESDSALAAFRDAAAMAPDRPELILGSARHLVELRRFTEAEADYRRVLRIAPGSIEATREYGLLLERVGRLGELGPLLDSAIGAGVPATELSLLQAMLAFRDKDLARALDLASRTMDDDPVRRHRLASKVHEAQGDMDAAFASATAMNRAADGFADWRKRGAAARAEIRRLARALTPDWAATMPRDEPGPRRSPAFIVGFPRSGTTLLDTFLMGHPDVVVLEEEPMLEAAKRVVGDLALLPSVDAATITRARAAYFADLDRRIDPARGGLIVDKMPFNMLGAPLIHRLFPDARIVFAQRHPCDVVLSGFMQSFRLNDGMASFLDLEDAADLYDAAMGLWTASRTLLPLTVDDLVYERLVADPARVLRPLVGFLGLEWRDELLDHQATARARGTIITPSYDQVTQPISRKAVGRWRRVKGQLAPVLPVLLPWARRLGYDEDGNYPAS